MTSSGATHRRFANVEEWQRLATGFEACTLTREQWDHEAHLAMAVWYLVWNEYDAAVERMRTGIQNLNAALIAVHGPPSSGRGYHETLTRFYMAMVHRALSRRSLGEPLMDTVNAVVAELADRSIPLTYYSESRLFSVEAKNSWVSPDLRSLE